MHFVTLYENNTIPVFLEADVTEIGISFTKRSLMQISPLFNGLQGDWVEADFLHQNGVSFPNLERDLTDKFRSIMTFRNSYYKKDELMKRDDKFRL